MKRRFLARKFKIMKRIALIVVALLLGVTLGLSLGYSMAPSTEPLQKQIDDLQNQIAEIGDLESQLAQKDNQIESLQEQTSDLIIKLKNLNQSYQRLLESYEQLSDDYKMLNGPMSAFVSAADLDFTITTHQHIYSYKDHVSGNVTIHYDNGTAFKGYFSILIEQVDGPGGSGWRSEVNGYGDFYVKPPAFLYGPGTYRIGLCTLWDSEGYIVATSLEIGHVYVTVEAK